MSESINKHKDNMKTLKVITKIFASLVLSVIALHVSLTAFNSYKKDYQEYKNLKFHACLEKLAKNQTIECIR